MARYLPTLDEVAFWTKMTAWGVIIGGWIGFVITH